jgi:hypothetical protein
MSVRLELHSSTFRFIVASGSNKTTICIRTKSMSYQMHYRSSSHLNSSIYSIGTLSSFLSQKLVVEGISYSKFEFRSESMQEAKSLLSEYSLV